jgi:hypothetical protein
VEGFKKEHIPKIELHRPSLGKRLLYPDDPDIIAIATDDRLATPPCHIPVLNLNQPDAIVDFLLNHFLPRCDNRPSVPAAGACRMPVSLRTASIPMPANDAVRFTHRILSTSPIGPAQ